MDIAHVISELKRNKEVLKSLLEGTDRETYLWKQNPEKWCMLEIVCHLYDEEREDFRARVKSVLENPELPLTPIDPVGWATERKYIERDYNKVLNDFLIERDNSVEWLKRLDNSAWNNFNKHPSLGDVRAAMFFVNWLAHDYLHIRQITKLKYDYLTSITNEDISYAGSW
jgi:hypothetical protein